MKSTASPGSRYIAAACYTRIDVYLPYLIIDCIVLPPQEVVTQRQAKIRSSVRVWLTIKARKAMRPEGHLDTLTSMSNLAVTYCHQGRWVTAEKLQVEVMAGLKAVLPEGHLDLLASINDLALTYSNQERWDEAEKAAGGGDGDIQGSAAGRAPKYANEHE